MHQRNRQFIDTFIEECVNNNVDNASAALDVVIQNNIEIKGGEICSVFKNACRKKNKEIIKFIVNRIEIVDEYNVLMFRDILSSDMLETSHYFITNNNQNIFKPEYIKTLVQYAKYETVLFFANLDKNDDKYIYFENACLYGKYQLAVWLVENYKINPNLYLDRALCLACQSGNLELIKWLVDEQHADCATSRHTPFLNACWRGHLNVVKWFVEEKHINSIPDIDDCFNGVCMANYYELADYLDENFTIDIHYQRENIFFMMCENMVAETLQWFTKKMKRDYIRYYWDGNCQFIVNVGNTRKFKQIMIDDICVSYYKMNDEQFIRQFIREECSGIKRLKNAKM
jgi:hypothetical protein